ncbi:MAG: DUF3849 domain-containing protein [Oscillospiraceae bacterium]|nr:DUF3849 domain-containing protein [Oscillospiraceae bacterium]
MDKDTIYKYPAAYAREHGELPQYHESRKALADCKAAIEKAIASKWDGWDLSQDAAKDVLKQFGAERVAYVLATTVQHKQTDKRFSQKNRDWAKTIPLYLPEEQRPDCVLESHSTKIDSFIDLARKDIAELAQKKTPTRQKPSAKHDRVVTKSDKTPLYKNSFEYAYQHGEADQSIASKRANIACRDAIEKAVASRYNGYSLDTAAAVKEVVEQFGFERMFYVLANTVQTMDWDQRVSQNNKAWAQTIPIVFEKGERDTSYLITRTHPGLLDMFVRDARHEHLLKQPLKAADIKAEAAHILERFQTAREPNSPDGTHYMVQVSPDFLARAKTKDTDRLISMLPFQSLALSTLEGQKGVYALISKDENRFQKLVLRKPSVRKKLQEKSDTAAVPRSPVKNKSRGQER